MGFVIIFNKVLCMYVCMYHAGSFRCSADAGSTYGTQSPLHCLSVVQNDRFDIRLSNQRCTLICVFFIYVSRAFSIMKE